MENIRTSLNTELEATEKVILAYPWEDPRAYAMWLTQTYHMVAHSTRLVALAGACCALDQNDLHARFIDHAKEERGHEKIAISDLQTLGYKIDHFPKLSVSQAMYQVQYYWIQHLGPCSFFGYTLALEALAVRCGRKMFDRVAAAHGASCARFLKLHSEDDVQHLEAAEKQISKLTGPSLELAKQNLVLSCDLYRGMLREGELASRLTDKKSLVA